MIEVLPQTCQTSGPPYDPRICPGASKGLPPLPWPCPLGARTGDKLQGLEFWVKGKCSERAPEVVDGCRACHQQLHGLPGLSAHEHLPFTWDARPHGLLPAVRVLASPTRPRPSRLFQDNHDADAARSESEFDTMFYLNPIPCW